MKYIKQFSNETTYNTAKSGSDFSLPSVSLLKDSYEVRYDNIVPGPTPVDPSDYSYLIFTKIANGKASVAWNNNYSGDPVTSLIIPEYVLVNNEILAVTNIQNQAFEGTSTFTQIILNDNIEFIGEIPFGMDNEDLVTTDENVVYTYEDVNGDMYEYDGVFSYIGTSTNPHFMLYKVNPDGSTDNSGAWFLKGIDSDCKISSPLYCFNQPLFSGSYFYIPRGIEGLGGTTVTYGMDNQILYIPNSVKYIQYFRDDLSSFQESQITIKCEASVSPIMEIDTSFELPPTILLNQTLPY
jgi:hypothetical protein